MKIYFLILILFVNNALLSQDRQSLLLDSLTSQLQNKNFDVSYSYKKIPTFIKKGIKKIEGKKFIIADKNENFKSADFNIKPNLPNKRVLYIGNSDSLMIIAYEQGRFRLPWKLKIIEYKGRKVRNVYNLAVPYHRSPNELEIILVNKNNIRVSDPFE